MTEILDVSFTCGDHAAALFQAGVRTVIRYYSRNTGIPAKRLTRKEALQMTQAGLRLGVVHEARRGDLIGSFTQDLGVQDAAYARDYAETVIGQPAGSAIYFAVDLDPSAAEIKAQVVPYFQGVAQAMAGAGYRIGVYGSGATCAAVLKAKLAELGWLAAPGSWAGKQAFLASGQWAMLQHLPATVGGIEGDPDEANPKGPGIGDFTLSGKAGPAARLVVAARDGLRLRSGPGLDFPQIGSLPSGATVFGLGTVGDWTQVDRQGDGLADGFASSHFLRPV